jgi:hypothetical protein
MPAPKKSIVRLSIDLPEDQYRYLYVVLLVHDPVSDTGAKAIDTLLKLMGDTIDDLNVRSSNPGE